MNFYFFIGCHDILILTRYKIVFLVTQNLMNLALFLTECKSRVKSMNGWYIGIRFMNKGDSKPNVHNFNL